MFVVKFTTFSVWKLKINRKNWKFFESCKSYKSRKKFGNLSCVSQDFKNARNCPLYPEPNSFPKQKPDPKNCYPDFITNQDWHPFDKPQILWPLNSYHLWEEWLKLHPRLCSKLPDLVGLLIQRCIWNFWEEKRISLKYCIL